MNKDLQGKKLLVLGSTAKIAQIVKKAQSMGVYTIVTDNRPVEKAPAKQIADQYFNIDFSKMDEMCELVRREKIDGVLTGFQDSYIEYYLELCERTGLPCYGDAHSFKVATDKATFKDACQGSRVPVIPGSYAKSYPEALAIAKEVKYPLIVKPVDNSGSRGVIKCDCEQDLPKAFEFAMSYSGIGQVMVEKYMVCENVATSYYVADGCVKLSTTADRYLYISPETGSSITSYVEYPSKYTERYLEETNEEVISMLKANGFSNGMLAFQAFVDEQSFYFCEMCFRPSGGHHFYFIENQNKVDQMALLIRFAVTGNCFAAWEKEKETPYFEKPCAMVKIIGKARAKIHKFANFENIAKLPNIISADKYLNEGDIIGADGTTTQVLGVIWYHCDNRDALKKFAYELCEMLVVEDDQGNNLASVSML